MKTAVSFNMLLICATASQLFAQLTITKEPANQSVSLGASATFSVSAKGTNPPIRYQWRLFQADLEGQTNSSLNLTNIQAINEGGYDAVVTDSSGSVTSRVATLTVDPTFSKITKGQVVTDGGMPWACVWGDYDNDGYLDLFVTNGDFVSGKKNFLYHNNRDGTFSRITLGAIVNDVAWFRGATWVDFDNDGNLDLSIVTHGTKNFLYRNSGDGTFSKVTNNIIVKDVIQNTIGGSWADYDRDGYLDFFAANANNVRDSLYRNDGEGAFVKITAGRIVTDIADGESCAWADYDNDGNPDLFVTNFRGTKNFLYHNIGDGTFERIPTYSGAGSIITDSADAHGCAWGDYDNDGFPDLFVANGSGVGPNEKSFLYHNDGNGTFTRMTNSVVSLTAGDSTGCAWGDYDNDGYLDLFVANLNQKNFLYRNNGDGTFTQVTEGSLVNDGGPGIPSVGCSWGDYNNDGFLDLVVANGGGPSPVEVNNFLYRNNGNSNAWIKIKCVGTVSNRSAIGAKVRVKATIGRKTFWQMREVSCGDGFASGNPLEAHFGLGDAKNIDTIRIEWPSGLVQILTNVAVKQFLTVMEPPRLLTTTTTGLSQFSLKGGRGFQYDISTSTDLTGWSSLGTITITNLSGTALITDTNPLTSDRRFYRAVSH
jgi:enediyne biosynthesis protein E4